MTHPTASSETGSPRNASQIFDEVVAIAKKTEAAQDRMSDLAMFARGIQGVMISQGIPTRRAVDATHEVIAAYRRAASALGDAVTAIDKANRLLAVSPAHLRTPFGGDHA